MAKPRLDNLDREKQLYQLAFDGVGKGETYNPKVAKLDPKSDKYRSEIHKRLLALAQIYDADISTAAGWRELAISMAIDFLPTFQLPNPKSADLKGPMPQYLARQMAAAYEPWEGETELRDSATAREMVRTQLAADIAAFNAVYSPDPPLRKPTPASVKKALQRLPKAAERSQVECAVEVALAHRANVLQVAEALSLPPVNGE
jgi:hypothetical protein